MKNIIISILFLTSILLSETIVPVAKTDSLKIQKGTGIIKGLITDENGDPLKGANVMVVGKTWGAETDNDGYYCIKEVREGEYMLKTQYLGCSPITKKSIKVVIDSTTTQNFKLKYEWNNNPKKKDFGNISGTVLNQDKKPLKGAKVSILGLDSTTVTQEDGRFYFNDIKCGIYSIQTELSGYEITLKDSIKICYGLIQLFFDIKLKRKECNDLEELEIEIFQDEKVEMNVTRKPIIYIYPEKETEVNVKLDIKGKLTCTYPKYPKEGWTVTAKPNGDLTTKDGKEYYSLYWEGISEKPFTINEGFVVKRENTIEFLETNLKTLGLNSREANEFIIYWLPILEKNPFNLIHFSTTEYEDHAQLTITPKPETLIRVFMVFKGLEKTIKIKEQILTQKQRKGYTVVEWGGCDLIEDLCKRSKTTTLKESDKKVRTIDMGTMETQETTEVAKPIIYIYPEKETEVNVKLEIKGKLTTSYPIYPKEGWTVTAKQNGDLTTKDGKEYYSLYWEGISEKPFTIDEGFVVKRENTIEFLETNLKTLGLNSREANEFIIYWLPILEKNPYNLIHFSTTEYEDHAKLTITPKPETLIRVFMVFKGLDKPQKNQAQKLTQKQRKGYTVVEWGGCDMTDNSKTVLK